MPIISDHYFTFNGLFNKEEEKFSFSTVICVYDFALL